jgi:hypothetical protein
MSARLPAGFEDIEPFADPWDLPDFNARRLARGGADMAEIRRFYDAMTPRAAAALDVVGRHPLHALPEDVARLYRLVLALAHVSMAVEVHGAPRAPFVPYPDSLRLHTSFSPFG